MLIQQGDVLIQSVNEIPDNVKEIKRKNGKLILAEGEATGHFHAVADPLAELFESEKDLFLNASSTLTVKHDEHKEVKVPPGKYRVYKVKEYDHFAEEARSVRD